MKIKYNVYLVFIFHFVFLHQKNRPYFLTARRHVALGVGHRHEAAQAVVGVLCRDRVRHSGAVVAHALERLAAGSDVGVARVTQSVGDARHQGATLHMVAGGRLGSAGVGHLGRAVEHIVLGAGGRNSVNVVAVAVYRVAVNRIVHRRVVGRDDAPEGVVNHAAARHYNPLSHRRADHERQQQQQQQQQKADIYRRLTHVNKYVLC